MLNQLPKRSLYDGGISKATCKLGFDSFVFEISILLFSSSKSEVQRFASVGMQTELRWCENDDDTDCLCSCWFSDFLQKNLQAIIMIESKTKTSIITMASVP